MRNLMKLAATPALALAIGAGTLAVTAQPAAAQFRATVSTPGFYGTYRDGYRYRTYRHRYYRPRTSVAIGIGVPSYYGYSSYPYDYSYYNNGYYDRGYNAYCDPYSRYYNPDYCGY